MTEQVARAPLRAGAGREQLCLLTGATGFIGGRLAARLLAEGYAVRALARPGSDTSVLERLGVEIAQGDLRDAASLQRAAMGAVNVLHCGALVSDWATVKELRAINVGGTRALADAAVRASVRRFIHVSSTDVYGHPGGGPIDEERQPAGFANWYSQTKLEAEAEVRRAMADSGLSAVILRPATVFGPGSRDVVGEIARAIRGGHMLLIGGGRAVAGLCYVENLLDAMLICLSHDAAPGMSFNVTDALAVTWREFCDGLAAGMGARRVRFSLPYPLAAGLALGLESSYRVARAATGLTLPPLLSRQAVQVLGRDQDFSNAKLRQAVGWEPRVGYEQGLGATLAWIASETR